MLLEQFASRVGGILVHGAHLAECRLAADAGSVRTARAAVADAVGEVLGPDDLDGALLATSEVVTNAIEHGEPPIELLVDQRDRHVRVEVRDGSPALPTARPSPAGPAEVRGRGMAIVEHCTCRWGVEPRPDGKAVWFELDVEPDDL